MNTFKKRPRRVADFNTLDDLLEHARGEGATHVLHIDDEVHVYFKRQDGQYEKAEVWQKDGYWHTQGPGSRVIVRQPPANAKAIVSRSLKAAEHRVETPELAKRYPRGWTLAKHLMDWSYRRKGAIQTISVATIRRQGYNVEQVKAALRDNDTFENFDGCIYSGSDGSGGMWRVEITQDGTTEMRAGRQYIIEVNYPQGSTTWYRYFVDMSWPSREEAEKYAKRWLSQNNAWRIVPLGKMTEMHASTESPVDVLRTLQPGDMVTVESRELPKPRKLVVTSLSQHGDGVYVTSGQVRPGHRSGGRLHAHGNEVFYDATIQQRPVRVTRLTRTAAALAEPPTEMHAGGRQATRPGKYDTLKYWRITYTDRDNPAFGEDIWHTWAYDKEAASFAFFDGQDEDESWDIVKIEPVLDTGPKKLSR